MMWNYFNGMWGLGIFGWLFMVAIMASPVIFIIWVIYLISESRHKGGSNALDVLDERYAKGEIEREEYETKKKDLTKHR